MFCFEIYPEKGTTGYFFNERLKDAEERRGRG